MAFMTTEILLTVEDAAHLLRVPLGTVRHFVRIGLLRPLVLPGGQIRIERVALEEFMESCR